MKQQQTLPLILILMMLFLMLWEARPRYFFGFVPVILLLASQLAEGVKEDI